MSEFIPTSDLEPRAAAPSVWRTGLAFRPFFLLGALHGAAVVLLWSGTLAGWWAIGDIGWHAREMVYGFGGAIIAGFLLTAVPRWTETRPLVGAPLAALVIWWLTARLSATIIGVGPLSTVLVSGFLFIVAAVLAVPVARARRWRNYGVPLIVAMLGTGALIEQLDAQGLGAHPLPRLCAVLVVALLMAVVGGRVIPFFTRSRFGDAVPMDPPRLWQELLALGPLALTVPISPGWPDSTALGLLLVVAGLANATRLSGWHATLVWREPMLAILFAGYGWLALGLLLTGVAIFAPGTIAPTTALHALTAGAMGSLILGMLARVSRGHTGRAIRADGMTVALFVAVTLAALLRVGGPLLAPAGYATFLSASAVAWTLAFGGFALTHGRMLLTPRPDGRAG